MHLGTAFVADEQAAELVQPGEGTLDNPAEAAEAGAVLGRAARDDRFDASLSELSTVALVVVAAVTDELIGPATRPAGKAAHRRHSVEERDQLGDVVAVAAGEGVGKRDTCLVDDQVVFGAQPATVNRARARLGAPFFACTWLESTTARAHSI